MPPIGEWYDYTQATPVPQEKRDQDLKEHLGYTGSLSGIVIQGLTATGDTLLLTMRYASGMVEQYDLRVRRHRAFYPEKKP